MSKTRKNDLVKRRKKLNQKQNKQDLTGLRVDVAHDDETDHYDVEFTQLLRGDLSPRRVESLLAEAVERLDHGVIRMTAQRLIDLRLADGELYAISGLAAMRQGFIHIALKDLRRAIYFGQEGPMVAQAIEMLPKIEAATSSLEYTDTLRERYTFDELTEAAYQNDRVQELMTQGEYDSALRFAERSIERFSAFLPLQNNVVQLAMAVGDFSKARTAANEAIVLHPDDVFAISNIAFLEWIDGHVEACKTRLDAIGLIPENRREALSNLMQVAYKVNCAERLIEIWEANEAIQNESGPESFLRDALLVAWAYGRVGKRAAGLAVLDRVQSRYHDERYRELRKDLQQHDELRIGVAPLGDAHWLPHHFLQSLKSQSDNIDLVRSSLQKFASRFPNFFEAILDRGPAASRRLFLQACYDAKSLSAPVLDALESFASGRWGETVDRMVARMLCHRNGRQVCRFWAGGDWMPEPIVSIEIHADSLVPADRTKRVRGLFHEAAKHVQNQDGAAAEAVYHEALKLEPEARDVRVNLITALALQNRNREIDEMVGSLYHDHPDYFPAQAQQVTFLLKNDRLSEAEALIGAMLSGRVRWHYSEAGTYGIVMRQLKMKQGLKAEVRQYGDWANACREFEHVMAVFD